MMEQQTPTLGGFVRTLRSRRGFTRQRLAAVLYTSVGYIAKIESGGARSPSVSVLEQLATAFKLTSAERRHLLNLARQNPTERESVRSRALSEYRAQVHSSHIEAMRSIQPHLMAYLDEHWNVVECNDEFDRAFPGLKSSGNVLKWFFLDQRSRHVMVDWEFEARYIVARCRAILGRYYADDTGKNLLAELRASAEFAEFWDRGEVEFVRPSAFMEIRDERTGKIFVINAILYSYMAEECVFLVYVGLRVAL